MFGAKAFAARIFGARLFTRLADGEEPAQPRIISAPPAGRRIQDPNRTRGDRRSRTWR